MYKGKTVAVVVPAYNEEDSVGEVIETVPGFVDRVYVVDDGSTDDTWRVISERASEVNAEHEGAFGEFVVPVRHERNRGVGGAIKTGYQRALADGVDVATVMAGDAQMDPDLLARFVDPVAEGRADYTKGNRFLHEDIRHMPRVRWVGNLALSYLTKVASGYWRIGDSQNGYAAISHEALEAIHLDDLYEFYGYCNELLVRLNVADMRVMDVPHSAEYLYDEDWSSHIQLGEYVPRVSLMLLSSFLWRLRTKHLGRGRGPDPLALFYGAGAGVGAASALGLVRAVAGRLRGAAGSTAPWLAGLALGALLFAFGAFLDRETDKTLERRGEEVAGGTSAAGGARSGRATDGDAEAPARAD